MMPVIYYLSEAGERVQLTAIAIDRSRMSVTVMILMVLMWVACGGF